jgi:O-antigen/teichoic acid export membrane protein
MEFGKHIGKGMWGLAGRALPSLYGVGIILFVIRAFPPVEFGVYTLLQTIFLLAVSTGQSFALQPLVKFAAGSGEPSGPVTASAILYAAFLTPVIVLLSALGGPLGSLFNSATAGELMHYVSLMLLVSIPRNVASYLLQARLELRKLFYLDAIYSIGSLVLIAVLVTTGKLRTAAGLMQVNILMLLLSSLYGVVLLAGKYALRVAPSPAHLRKAWDYGRYSLGASVSYTLFSQSDNLLISALTGPVPLAVYNAAKVFARAFDLLMQTISTLLVPVVARAHDRGDRAGLTVLAEKSLFFFTLAAAGMCVGLLALGEPVMSFLYGGKYAEAVPVLRVLAVAGLFVPGVAVGASFCNGVAKMRPVFYLNLLTALAGVGLIALLTGPFGVQGTAWAVLATFALVWPAWMFVLVRSVDIPLTARNVLRRHADITGFIRERFRNV